MAGVEQRAVDMARSLGHQGQSPAWPEPRTQTFGQENNGQDSWVGSVVGAQKPLSVPGGPAVFSGHSLLHNSYQCSWNFTSDGLNTG